MPEFYDFSPKNISSWIFLGGGASAPLPLPISYAYGQQQALERRPVQCQVARYHNVYEPARLVSWLVKVTHQTPTPSTNIYNTHFNFTLNHVLTILNV